MLRYLQCFDDPNGDERELFDAQSAAKLRYPRQPLGFKNRAF